MSSQQRSEIQTLRTAKGLALQDILTEVHLYIHRSRYIFLQLFKYRCQSLWAYVLIPCFLLLLDGTGISELKSIIWIIIFMCYTPSAVVTSFSVTV